MTIVLQNNRIDYIDAIKGFTILWVVIYHFGTNVNPEWVMTPYRMPLFFFLSGIFFRKRSFKTFFVRRVNTLIVPLIFWLFISWLYLAIISVLKLFLNKYIAFEVNDLNVIWSSLEQLKYIVMPYNGDSDSFPFFLNGPLWFLLGLFYVQLLYYGICRIFTERIWILLFILALYILGHCIFIGVYLANDTLGFILFYALGHLFGNDLIETIKDTKKQLILGIISLAILVSLILLNLQGDITKIVSLTMEIICFICLMFIIFHLIGRARILKPLRFFGQNSLVVLATHMLIMSIGNTFALKILSYFSDYNELQYSTSFYLIMFTLTCLVNYFVIKFCNKYIPIFVGKKPLFKIK